MAGSCLNVWTLDPLSSKIRWLERHHANPQGLMQSGTPGVCVFMHNIGGIFLMAVHLMSSISEMSSTSSQSSGRRFHWLSDA